jgi:hypothetical protein
MDLVKDDPRPRRRMPIQRAAPLIRTLAAACLCAVLALAWAGAQAHPGKILTEFPAACSPHQSQSLQASPPLGAGKRLYAPPPLPSTAYQSDEDGLEPLSLAPLVVLVGSTALIFGLRVYASWRKHKD